MCYERRGGREGIQEIDFWLSCASMRVGSNVYRLFGVQTTPITSRFLLDTSEHSSYNGDSAGSGRPPRPVPRCDFSFEGRMRAQACPPPHQALRREARGPQDVSLLDGRAAGADHRLARAGCIPRSGTDHPEARPLTKPTQSHSSR